MPFYCLCNDMYKLVGEQQQQLSALTVVGSGLAKEEIKIAEQDWKQKEDKAADAKREWDKAMGEKDAAAEAQDQWQFYEAMGSLH